MWTTRAHAHTARCKVLRADLEPSVSGRDRGEPRAQATLARGSAAKAAAALADQERRKGAARAESQARLWALERRVLERAKGYTAEEQD